MDVQDFRLEIWVILPYYKVIVHSCPPLFPSYSVTLISMDVSCEQPPLSPPPSCCLTIISPPPALKITAWDNVTSVLATQAERNRNADYQESQLSSGLIQLCSLWRECLCFESVQVISDGKLELLQDSRPECVSVCLLEHDTAHRELGQWTSR